MKNKVIIICSIFIILLILAIQYIFINKPIEFEQFNSNEETISYLDKNYPIDSDINILLKDFKNSGAECGLVTQDDIKEMFVYDKIYFCTYFTGWIPPKHLIHFDITIFINENGNIVNRFVKRHNARQTKDF